MKKTERSTKGASGRRSSLPGSTASKKTTEKSLSLNLDEVRELIKLASENEFTVFELHQGDFSLRLKKGVEPEIVEIPIVGTTVPNTIAEAQPVSASIAAASPAPEQSSATETLGQSEEEQLHIITSPLVGTFYRAASPTAEPFVKPGDIVENGMTLCIIEAMKLMNEIQSDAAGTVTKIFVENGQPVEYGQPLFGLKQ